MSKFTHHNDNHLGNLPAEMAGVMVIISDRKVGRNTNGTVAHYYLPYIVSISDYYAFGSAITERSWTAKGYQQRYACLPVRQGFNNQEKETELGDCYSFEYRIHDARLGRFLSVDPLSAEYPWNSPYAFAENMVIIALDLEGAEAQEAVKHEMMPNGQLGNVPTTWTADRHLRTHNEGT